MMAIERRSFLKILGLAGLFPAAIGKEAIAEPAPPKPVTAPKPARVKRQPKFEARPFPECEVREITFRRDPIEWHSLDGSHGYRDGLLSVEWEVWAKPKSRAAAMIYKLTEGNLVQPVRLRHYDKRQKCTYAGEAYLTRWALEPRGLPKSEPMVIKAYFTGTGPCEVTYRGESVSPRGVIRFA